MSITHPVVQFDLKGNQIKSFALISKAAESVGSNAASIRRCCSQETLQHKGYIWLYAFDIENITHRVSLLNKNICIDLEFEEWRPVVGFEGLYEVSNKGRVKSLACIRRTTNGGLKKTLPKILTPAISRCGYNQYCLHYYNGSKKNMRGNRLVAMAFIPNPDNLPYVNHKDENKLNDEVENLEWCTPKYNVNYGTAKIRASFNNGHNKSVCQYDMDGNFINRFYNIHQAAKSVNGQHTTIVQCCRHQTLSYKSYIWLYSDDTEYLAEVVLKNKKSHNFHQVIRIDKADGSTVKYNSISEASRLNGISREMLKLRFKKQYLDNKYKWIKL